MFGVLFMIPAFISVIGGLTIPVFDVELSPFEGALSWTAPIAGVWMLIGIVLYFVLRARNPRRCSAWARSMEVRRRPPTTWPRRTAF